MSLEPTNTDVILRDRTKIDLLHKQIFECEKCNLSKTRNLVCVKRGSNSSKIIIVGEAPGQNEDETGIPFIGDSGILLERILLSVKLDSKDIYITNIVKCRPSGNRKPTNEEVKTCKPWLLEQLETIKPQILVLLGATAYTGLFGTRWVDKANFGITKHRGVWFESLCCPNTICSFHPSYLLHNWKLEEGSPKYLVWQDFIKIKDKYDKIMSNTLVKECGGSH